MTAAKSRRRFFQYSLGTLLVFVALICVLLAVRTNRQHNRRVAIAKIRVLQTHIFEEHLLSVRGQSS
jgi:hypothetical protein